MSDKSTKVEAEILLNSARARADERSSARLRELCAGAVDWLRLYHLARRHAVLPTVFVQLKAHARDLMPAEIFVKFKRDFDENAARNLLLTSELERLASKFELNGVGLLAYKGPALAASAYGSVSLRRFVDLDVLVRDCDVRKAQELLAEFDYRPHVLLTPAQEERIRHTQHNLSYSNGNRRLIVELHWGVASTLYARTRTVEEMFERAVNVRLLGREIKAPAPEDLLLALSVHGTKHLWERLAWVCDLAEIVSANPALSWDNLWSGARRLRVERMLGLGLTLAERLFDAPLPTQMSIDLRLSSSLTRAYDEVTANAFAVGGKESGIGSNIAFNLSLRERASDKLRYLKYIMTPTDGDYTSLALPSGLSFLYFFYRPYRLIFNGGGH